MIKDEQNQVYKDVIHKVLAEEERDRRQKRAEEQKGAKKKDEDGDGEPKEIDFKEKALKAKEQALKKITHNAMKNQGGGGGDGPNSQKKANNFTKFTKTIRAIASNGLLPCVVFCFSKQQTIDVPKALDEKLDFTDGTEKGKIKAFLKQKIQRLSLEDQKLPQVQDLQNLFVRGIGVHNAGMLPFMKEIVEIMFADGLLKVVFATTTFAIGLNMPARSVLFTKVFKFAGGEGEELVETSEYLQMAGRAGRRGKDQTGSCVICLDRSFGRTIPTVDDFEKLLENKGTPLESKLKLSYSMTMNVMKSDSIMIEDMLKVSWFESENEKERTDAMRRANIIQKRIEKNSHFECPFGCTEDLIKKYMEMYREVTVKNRNIMTIVNKDIQQKCIIECLGPDFFAEPLLVLRGNTENDDSLICLFARNNYVPPQRFGEEVERKNGYILQSVYFEYVTVRTH